MRERKREGERKRGREKEEKEREKNVGTLKAIVKRAAPLIFISVK